MNLKPNFFIVGTPKAGTTSLFHYLESHPEVFVPKIKEPHFFSSPEVKNTYYKTKIIDNQETYNSLFTSDNPYKAIGDFSSSYLFNNNSAKRIKSFNPKAKIIIVLRNPVERALSHYLMDFSLGYINVPLLDVINNKKQYKAFYQQYIELGFYSKQIEAYKQHFSSSQIKILLSDNLYTNTNAVLEELFGFIGVSKSFKPDLKKKYNQYKEPRFKFLKQITQSTKLKTLIPSGLKNTFKSIIYKQNTEKPKLDIEKDLLQKIYSNTIQETERVANLDLSFWN